MFGQESVDYVLGVFRHPDLNSGFFLWAPAQRKRATMLYFGNVYLFIFYGRLILRPWLTDVRESFTRGGP